MKRRKDVGPARVMPQTASGARHTAVNKAELPPSQLMSRRRGREKGTPGGAGRKTANLDTVGFIIRWKVKYHTSEAGVGDAALERSGQDSEKASFGQRLAGKRWHPRLFRGPVGGAGGVIPGSGDVHTEACANVSQVPSLSVTGTSGSLCLRGTSLKRTILPTATHPPRRGGAAGLPRGPPAPPLGDQDSGPFRALLSSHSQWVSPVAPHPPSGREGALLRGGALHNPCPPCLEQCGPQMQPGRRR